ncbi:MAG: TIGR02646 family protein, partial [Endozoicomonadaceae bacterium]|nr:TIGR02646 family protein [Endozoicomonadaceae bacterium]
MRYIKKTGSAPYCLNKKHKTPPKNKTEATKQWRKFKCKNKLTHQLADEQYSLCAYSEIEILRDHSILGTHIEHVQPKSIYPQRTFDYSNLVLNALASDDLSGSIVAKNAVFGGHAKEDNYDPNLFISCLDPACTDYFTYLSDGKVVPTKDSAPHKEKAEYTINLL